MQQAGRFNSRQAVGGF